MSTSAVDISVSLPDEVASLGTPEQVFPPATRRTVPLTYHAITVSLVVMALILLVAAALFTGMVVPGGLKAPPQEVQMYFGIPTMIFGLISLVGAAWHGMGSALHARSYLLYKDVLVELAANRHRIIPWAKIGRPSVIAGLFRGYRFAIRDEKPIRFDFSMPRHDELAQAISRRHLLQALGGEEAVATLAPTPPTPYFLACSSSMWQTAVYRISVFGEHLLFLLVGDGDTEDPTKEKRYSPAASGAAGAAGSLAVAMGTWARMNSYQKFCANMQRAEGADGRGLVDLASEWHGSFVLAVRDLRTLRIDEPGWAQQLGLCGQSAGRLTLVQSSGEQLKLDLPSLSARAAANQELAAIRIAMRTAK